MATKKKATEEKKEVIECLKVTHVQVFPFKPNAGVGGMKGLANIVLNDQIQVRGLRIMNGENGLFVQYPSDPAQMGMPYITPITRALREHIEATVIEKYNKENG